MEMKKPQWNLSNVRVLITGASSGLGLAMARAVSAAGAAVAVAGRDETRVAAAVASLPSASGKVLAIRMDVRSMGSVEEAQARIQDAWGGIDVLVANAGIGMRTVNPRFPAYAQPFWEVPLEGFEAVIDTNLTGYFRVALTFTPGLVSQGRGKIVIISMNHETMRRKGFIPYGPSRAATESLAHIMAQDLKDSGVTVNMLLPGGATATGMIPDTVPEEFARQLLHPDVMGRPITFLCSSESDSLNDERLVATGFDAWYQDWKARGNA